MTIITLLAVLCGIVGIVLAIIDRAWRPHVLWLVLALVIVQFLPLAVT